MRGARKENKNSQTVQLTKIKGKGIFIFWSFSRDVTWRDRFWTHFIALCSAQA